MGWIHVALPSVSAERTLIKVVRIFELQFVGGNIIFKTRFFMKFARVEGPIWQFLTPS